MARGDGGRPERDGGYRNGVWTDGEWTKNEPTVTPKYFRNVCGKCGATRQDKQLGLEPTIAEYVANMVEVFRLVRDVLADDGTLWLNLGDSYYSNSSGQVKDSMRGVGSKHDFLGSTAVRPTMEPGARSKNLVGVPWRVAFALQADGWYLRSDIIWSKPNPMPESVTDRPTKAHEYLFLLSKRERYYYDAAAIAEDASEDSGYAKQRANGVNTWEYNNTPARIASTGQHQVSSTFGTPGKRNRRTVWTIATQPYADAHFAVMPRALVEPCILAGTSERGHCPACGKGWERATESTRTFESGSGRSGNPIHGKQAPIQGAGYGDIRMGPTISTRTTGWAPGCACGIAETVPGVVLDPFLGSGTVAQVAQDLGRRWVGCELNESYVAMQTTRTAQQGMALHAQ